MKKSNCPQCGSKAKLSKQKYKSAKTYAGTSKPIVLDANYLKCSSRGCGFTWMTADEAESIEGQISKLSWNSLKSDQWAMLRECLGFKTKTKASRFLGLNDKAFSKYERGYTEPNFSIDLLLRLIVHSRENFKFVKELHKKDFKFDSKDYQLVCDKTGDSWVGKAVSVYTIEPDTLQGTTNRSGYSEQVPLELLFSKEENGERSYT